MVNEKSTWEIENKITYPALSENTSADVIIIGGGITGVFNAYILASAGIKVVLLEENEKILQDTTLFTTAFITKIIDTSFKELVELFGKENAELVWKSGQEAINLIAAIVKKENIDCEFALVPICTYATNEKEFKKITEECAAIKKSGFEVNIYKDSKKLSFKNSGFLEIPAQAKFHPIKFAEALAEAAVKKGARIFTDSRVIEIKNATVKTKNYEVQTKDILIATYPPFTNEGTRFKKGMYTS